MTFAIIAAVCMLASLGLFRGSGSFHTDAGPVGSVMLAGGVALFLLSILLAGVSIGTVVGSVVS